GDVVLDPFLGSGTTAEAAMRTGRDYVGYELDKGYADLARERLAAVHAELAVEPAVEPTVEPAGEPAGRGAA
ncbi:MAG TPA: DNA adenine methylase, partial [Acidimicrobiaceae bacterium]|nr:DNA adenine methylase [Acidimicrobiaceae bacterium]